MIAVFSTLASFVLPVNIGTTPASVLWILPLSLAISIVYKATKLDDISWPNLIKESAVLFASIIIFMVIIAVAMCLIENFVL